MRSFLWSHRRHPSPAEPDPGLLLAVEPGRELVLPEHSLWFVPAALPKPQCSQVPVQGFALAMVAAMSTVERGTRVLSEQRDLKSGAPLDDPVKATLCPVAPATLLCWDHPSGGAGTELAQSWQQDIPPGRAEVLQR